MFSTENLQSGQFLVTTYHTAKNAETSSDDNTHLGIDKMHGVSDVLSINHFEDKGR